MPKKPAPAASGAMPRRSAAVIAPSRLASDPVATAIEAHKFAAALEKQAFDALLDVVPGSAAADRSEVIAYVATLDPAFLPRIFKHLLLAMTGNRCPSEARH